MRHHQKYFSVETPDGNLATQFVAVTNTDGDREGLIQRGNERVLRARFNDARFFWNPDQQKKLDRSRRRISPTSPSRPSSAPISQKTERVVALRRRTSAATRTPQRAALLSKDRSHHRTRQGIHRTPGRHRRTLRARPGRTRRSRDRDLRSLQAGQHGRFDSRARRPARSLSIADKLDTLRGCFSRRPDSLRLERSRSRCAAPPRASSRFWSKANCGCPIRKFVCAATSQLEEFLLDRVRYYFREIRGFKYDEVNAVLASGWDDLVDVEERLEAVQAVRPTPDFEPLAASFKRISNILKQAQFEGQRPQHRSASCSSTDPKPTCISHFVATRVRGPDARLPRKRSNPSLRCAPKSICFSTRSW